MFQTHVNLNFGTIETLFFFFFFPQSQTSPFLPHVSTVHWILELQPNVPLQSALSLQFGQLDLATAAANPTAQLPTASYSLLAAVCVQTATDRARSVCGEAVLVNVYAE